MCKDMSFATAYFQSVPLFIIIIILYSTLQVARSDRRGEIPTGFIHSTAISFFHGNFLRLFRKHEKKIQMISREVRFFKNIFTLGEVEGECITSS